MKTKIITFLKLNLLGIILIGISIYYAIDKFQYAYYRLYQNIIDFGLSFALFICKLFNIPNNITTNIDKPINVPSNTPNVIIPSNPLPETSLLFKDKINIFFKELFNMNYFAEFIITSINALYYIILLLALIIPLIVIIKIIFKKNLLKENNDYNIDSKNLVIFKKFTKPILKVYYTIKDIVKKILPIYLIFAFIIWLLNFNIISVVFGGFAYYFYFVSSFSFQAFYLQFIKLFTDLKPMFEFIPLPIYIMLFIYLFDKFRKSIAYQRLQIYENRNKAYLDELPLITLSTATVGKGKTTFITDQALSQEEKMLKELEEIMYNATSDFPYFPFILLENNIKEKIKNKEINTLVKCRSFALNLAKNFNNNPNKENLYNYDFEKYGLFFDNKLENKSIFKMIMTYTQAYYIYTIESSLIMANYSIRSDKIFCSIDNFPIWDINFFKRDTETSYKYSKNAKILDFDMLRLGKTLTPDNPNKDMLEFGIINITEGGKERGNMLENKKYDEDDETANPKNDKLNLRLKMMRHLATIDNKPFISIRLDDQRPESLGADARDLCTIQHIRKKSENKLALPFFFFEELLHDRIYKKFINFYKKYRYARGDNTLFMHITKTIAFKLHNYYKRIYNTFSFYKLQIQTEAGTQNDEKENKTYYLSTKKIYSNRFSTDCFSEIFAVKTERSTIGWEDIPSYEDLKASYIEMLKSNSYVVNQMLNIVNYDKLSNEELEKIIEQKEKEIE